MNVYDDIDLKLSEMPDGINDIETILLAVNAGIILYPLVRIDGKAAVRDFLVKLAATIVHGIELVDAEGEDSDECEHP